MSESMIRSDARAGDDFVERMLRVHPLTIGAVYDKGGVLGHGYVLNLSVTGIFLTADERFERGDLLHLRFFLPFQVGAVEADVAVRWRSDGAMSPEEPARWGFGLEFVELEEEMRSRIEHFVERFVELASALDN